MSHTEPRVSDREGTLAQPAPFSKAFWLQLPAKPSPVVEEQVTSKLQCVPVTQGVCRGYWTLFNCHPPPPPPVTAVSWKALPHF